jgi:hypothetical protein
VLVRIEDDPAITLGLREQPPGLIEADGVDARPGSARELLDSISHE